MAQTLTWINTIHHSTVWHTSVGTRHSAHSRDHSWSCTARTREHTTSLLSLRFPGSACTIHTYRPRQGRRGGRPIAAALTRSCSRGAPPWPRPPPAQASAWRRWRGWPCLTVENEAPSPVGRPEAGCGGPRRLPRCSGGAPGCVLSPSRRQVGGSVHNERAGGLFKRAARLCEIFSTGAWAGADGVGGGACEVIVADRERGSISLLCLRTCSPPKSLSR